MLNIPFDIIGISEFKQQVRKDFLVNVQMDGYSMYSQPSKSSCGGCVLDVSSMLNHHIKDDLSAIEDDYETIWIEINNHKSKNLLCCCLYMYPSEILRIILVQSCKKYRRKINRYSLWVILILTWSIIIHTLKPMILLT